MTWPAVFDGVGALFVRCDNDPDVQAARIPGLTWCAVKTNGPDASPPEVRAEWLKRVTSHGISWGHWVYCAADDPMVDALAAATLDPGLPGPAFTIYDVESEYKTDEGAPADKTIRLVEAHHACQPSLSSSGVYPAAVTSYGAIPGNGNFPSSIDFAPFAVAGWPIFAQAYDGFTVEDAKTYRTDSGQQFPGPYPASGVHNLIRSHDLKPGQAVYRPEGL